ncbi:MAG: hypothetical protein JWP34_1429 [Massilia sp.]|nr:hypothetical protein [Massilia sp.]
MSWAPDAVPGGALDPSQPTRPSVLWAFVLSVLLLALFDLTAVGAQSGADGAHLERNVKAAFLYKFLGYVEYPESALPNTGEPLVIGVLGDDEVAEELRRISTGRSMNGRAVVVRKLRANDAPGKLHLLFIGDGDAADIDKALAAVRQAPVLTVTETSRNLRQDSVINFRVVDERVRFEVSLDAAERNNLKLSSRLLAVAYKVQRNGK